MPNEHVLGNDSISYSAQKRIREYRIVISLCLVSCAVFLILQHVFKVNHMTRGVLMMLTIAVYGLIKEEQLISRFKQGLYGTRDIEKEQILKDNATKSRTKV